MEPKQLSRRDGNQHVGEGDAEKMPPHGSPAQPCPSPSSFRLKAADTQVAQNGAVKGNWKTNILL